MTARELSCEHVIRAHLERIDGVNPLLNALVEPVEPERCIAQARDADQRAARGEALGRMHGLPVVLKDVFYAKGLTCSGGVEALRAVATTDATVVSRLKDEGAIILGLTNVPAMSRGGESNNDLYGRTNNPYDLETTPGGSSGGSSALVAAGGAAFSVGSDGGGSVRQPCHNTGLAGLKPTHGRIPKTGSVFGDAAGIFSQFVSYGTLARSVDDLALGLAILAGADGRDPYAPPLAVTEPSAIDLSRLRIAFFTDDGTSPPSQAISGLVADVAEALREVTALVEVGAPACLERTMELLWETVFLGGDRGCGFKEDLKSLGVTDTSDELAEFLRQAEQIEFSVSELRTRLVEIESYRLDMLSFMDSYDVLLSPAMPSAAKPHGHGLNEIRDFSYMMVHNLTGWPAAVVRCGTSDDGLPIGVQVAAKPWEDATVLAVTRHLEDVFGGWQPPALVAQQA